MFVLEINTSGYFYKSLINKYLCKYNLRLLTNKCLRILRGQRSVFDVHRLTPYFE